MVSVPGAELHTVVRGQGPTCLFLCSTGTRPAEVQTPPALTDRLRLVYVDLRGSGRSTGAASDLTFDVLAQDLEAVRAHLGVDQVAVLGHSVLGMPAIEYGRRCPETVSHVIAVGTPPRGDMASLQASADAFFERDASDERKQILRENMARLPPGAQPWQIMLAQSPKRFHDPRFDAAPLFAEAELRPELLMHLFTQLTPGWDVTAGAGTLRVPTFLALGRHDYVVPHTLWETVAPTLPSFTVKLFERSGHQAFFEEPEAFATAVSDWMQRSTRG
jgi:proline iminopeptidase